MTAATTPRPRTKPSPPGRPVRTRITVTGVVQGVGFRPFVHRLATELGVTGFVGNDAAAVFIEAQGTPRAVSEFTRRLSAEPPPLALINAISAKPVTPRTEDGFLIVALRQRRRPAHARPARRRHLRRLPAGAVRPGQPTVPPPVHHLHQLRSPVHDHQGSPV